MSKPNKLAAVVRHEYFTIVKQPVFWLIMLAIPTLIAAVIAISYFSGKSSESRIEEAAKNIDNIAVIDKSGLISQDVAQAGKVELLPASQEQRVIKEVKQNKLDGAIIYPENLTETRSYNIYVGTTDITQSSTLGEFGDNLLESSLFAPLGSAEIITLAQNGASGNVIAYDNGRQTAGFMEYIVPGAFIVLFYIVLVFSVNYMLTSVAEEKENRSMEMVLSYVKPRTLIFGKLLGISLVTLTQLAFMLVVIVIAYFIARNIDGLNLPLDINLTKLVFDPAQIVIAVITLVAGFLLFAALMAGLGSMVPSAKDAGGLSFVFIIGAVVPFYTLSVLFTDPGNTITKVMTFFPTSAPTTILIRNTADNLAPWEAALAVSLLVLFAFLSVLLAGKLFKLGALEFNNRVSLKGLFRKS